MKFGIHQYKQIIVIISIIIFLIYGFFLVKNKGLAIKEKSAKFLFNKKIRKLKFQSMKNGEWQILKRGNNVIYFHRAIYDPRKFPRYRTPSITMYALSNTRTVSEMAGVTCNYIFNNKTITEKPKIWLFTTGYRYKETHLQEYVFNCPVNKVSFIPTYIFLRRDSSSAIMKIEIPYHGKNLITLCVPLVYGSIDTTMVIEWFEYQRQLGIDLIELSVWQVTEKLLNIFKYYESINFLILNIVDIPYKVVLREPGNPLHPSRKPFFLKAFMPLPLNECFLMNALRSKYILSLDFDEFIFMNTKNFSKYSHLIRHYDKKPNFVNLLIGKIDIDVTCKEKQKHDHFIFQHKYRQKLSKMVYLYNPKSFVNAKNCPFVGNHYCIWKFEKTQKYFPMAEKKYAFVAHFRKKENCGKDLSDYIKDHTINDLEIILSKRFRKIKKLFKKKNII